MKKFFSTDKSYKESVSRYTKADAVSALILYVFLIAVYYFMGVLYVQKQIYLGVYVNLILILVCVFLVLMRKQKLESIGITMKNIGKSLTAGAVSGIIFTFFLNVLPNIIIGGKIISPSQMLYNVFYYFIVIALSEEIVFRGYIQTRIYGLIKHDAAAVIVTGFLFYFMHLPFQMPVNGMQINILNMIIMVVLHVVMNFLYRKYNSIAAPTIFHGLLDWGGNLLI